MTKAGVLIIGASSGMGSELALRYAEAGHPVAIVARRPDELEKVRTQVEFKGVSAFAYPHDVRAYGAIPELFKKILADLGSLETMVYAAGILPRTEIDEFSADKDVPVVEVNLTGAVAWLDEAARYFQAQGKGRICGISSIAGDRGRRAFPAYHAAKAGLTTFLEALDNRLWSKGVQVTTIKPGFIDTDMTKGMAGLFWLIRAEEASRIIKKHVDKGRRVAYVPWRWGLVALVIKTIPASIFRRLKI